MKFVLLLLLTFTFTLCVKAQPSERVKNIIVVTIDGFRWEELFTGADSSLLHNTLYTDDPTFTEKMYWAGSAEERRKKLLPFTWNIIGENGQIYGNRHYNNQVNVENIFQLSYPGYNELFTGAADLIHYSNRPVKNKKENVLSYLNSLPEFAGKVAVFSSWNVFPYIFNEEDSHLPVNGGYESMAEDSIATVSLINRVQGTIQNNVQTRFDLLTYVSAKEYLQLHHPRVMLLGLGETDEEAHQGHYRQYLQKASMADQLIGELYSFVQADPFYKDQTVFIITTDHGRSKKDWSTHGFLKKGSGATWLVIAGPGIEAKGEIKADMQLYSSQLASTIALLLGKEFKPAHAVSSAYELAGDHSFLSETRQINLPEGHLAADRGQ